MIQMASYLPVDKQAPKHLVLPIMGLDLVAPRPSSGPSHWDLYFCPEHMCLIACETYGPRRDEVVGVGAVTFSTRQYPNCYQRQHESKRICSDGIGLSQSPTRRP
jgi:hypothetical protein